MKWFRKHTKNALKWERDAEPAVEVERPE